VPAPPANRVSPDSDFLPQFLRSQHLSSNTLEPWLHKINSAKEICPRLGRILKPLADALIGQAETKPLGLLCQRVRLRAKLRETEQALRIAIDLKEELREAPPEEPIPKALVVEAQEPSEDCNVADPDLQKKVCRAVFQILSQNGFEAENCKSLALRIERRLRAKDPSMCGSYRSLYKRMIKDIRLLTPEGVLGAAPSVSHSTD